MSYHLGVEISNQMLKGISEWCFVRTMFLEININFVVSVWAQDGATHG